MPILHLNSLLLFFVPIRFHGAFSPLSRGYNVSMQWPGCLFCSLDYVPPLGSMNTFQNLLGGHRHCANALLWRRPRIFTAPRAISDGLVLQDGLLLLVCDLIHAMSFMTQ